MVQNSDGKFENFASTGGWRLATKPITELYASLDLIPLTKEQQKFVEEVAQSVYRPCCNNPTHFPDCNHGMAMLGILELMASQGATVDEMFEAAKYVNAYWFPQQTLEAALYLKANQEIDFADADPRLVVCHPRRVPKWYMQISNPRVCYRRQPIKVGAAPIRTSISCDWQDCVCNIK
jgi:hypothetical protein